MFEEIKKVIAEQLSVDEDTITLETSLVEDLKADSLDIVEMVMELESEFDVEIPDEELSAMKTVKDVVSYIEKIKE